MAEARISKKAPGAKVQDAPKENEKPENEEPQTKNFVVVPAENVALVQCPDEKSAATAVALDSGYAGKFLVVEVDFVELLTATFKVDLKSESVDKFVEESMRQNGDDGDQEE